MTVYYTNLKNIFVEDPAPLFSDFFKSIDDRSCAEVEDLKRCPAVKDYCDNTFILRNPIAYELRWEDNGFFSSMRDQEFFNENVKIRSIPAGFFSYRYPLYFFLSDEPLLMEQLPPFLHDVDLAKKVAFLPGVYDIGKHFRGLDTAMFARNKSEVISLKEGDPFCYIKFHTDKRIKFKRFMFTSEMNGLVNSILQLRQTGKPKPMEFWYSLFKNSYRKKFLNMAKKNLM